MLASLQLSKSQFDTEAAISSLKGTKSKVLSNWSCFTIPFKKKHTPWCSVIWWHFGVVSLWFGMCWPLLHCNYCHTSNCGFKGMLWHLQALLIVWYVSMCWVTICILLVTQLCLYILTQLSWNQKAPVALRPCAIVGSLWCPTSPRRALLTMWV